MKTNNLYNMISYYFLTFLLSNITKQRRLTTNNTSGPLGFSSECCLMFGSHIFGVMFCIHLHLCISKVYNVFFRMHVGDKFTKIRLM